jgi:hypothetical protein
MKKINVNRIKPAFIIIFTLFTWATVRCQVFTSTLSITSITQLEPIIMFDSTDFSINLTATDSIGGGPDTILGDLLYYYLTDSMINAGAPARVINESPANVLIGFTFTDTLTIDIRPDEIRTTPVNLIILWPAILNPAVADSVSDTILVQLDGFLGLKPDPVIENRQIIFPSPALQYIYIRPEELGYIKEIEIFTLQGQLISHHAAEEFRSGLIDLSHLASGNYLVKIHYVNQPPQQTKIQKQ